MYKYIHFYLYNHLHLGAPRNIDTEAVERALESIPNVMQAHSVHIWSLTVNKAALAAHLAISEYIHVHVHMYTI